MTRDSASILELYDKKKPFLGKWMYHSTIRKDTVFLSLLHRNYHLIKSNFINKNKYIAEMFHKSFIRGIFF